MFENVNTPQTPPSNQPDRKDPKDWGPWKPVDNNKKTAGPIPPPPLDQNLSDQKIQVPPTQNPNINVPGNVNVPGSVTTDLPEPSKRRFVLIGIIIFALLIVLIAGAIYALDYFSNTNENVNNTNLENVSADSNNSNTTNTNENINTTANKNLNSIFDVNTNDNNSNIGTAANVNTRVFENSNSTTNTNVNINTNTNTIINSALLDSDGDGLTDENEEIYGTDRINPDTDGDGYLDGDEIKNGYNPLCNPATAAEKGCNPKL